MSETIDGPSRNNDGRGSPAAQRTVSLLDFFADHPSESFTLTEISRALRISPATCLSILAALAAANYLMRDTGKRYRLGPALARVAAAAASSGGALALAKPEMRALADRYDVICSAIFPEAGEAVVRERAASLSHVGWASQLGGRFPLAPPFGTVFFAWASAAEIERWIAGSTDKMPAPEEPRIRASLAFARTHGFAPGLRTERLRGEKHAQSLIYRTDKTDYLVAEVEPKERYDLAFVSAPVFDADGRVIFALALMGFVSAASGDAVLAIGRTLGNTCARLTKASGGQSPFTVARP